MRYLFLIFSCLSFTACASISQKDFNKGDVSQEQFDRDHAACEVEADKYVAIAGRSSAWVINGNYVSFMEKCMRSKGYKKLE